VSFSGRVSIHHRYENLAGIDLRMVLFDWSLKGNKRTQPQPTMKNKAVRLVTVLICCLAIPLVASAAEDNNNKKKKQGQQQQQAQHPGQPAGKHQNAGANQ
jgi:hypothetical protein